MSNSTACRDSSRAALSFLRDRYGIDTAIAQALLDAALTRGGEYAELYFESCLWPDFSPARLQAAVTEFRRRERRFGGLSRAVAG